VEKHITTVAVDVHRDSIAALPMGGTQAGAHPTLQGYFPAVTTLRILAKALHTKATALATWDPWAPGVA